MEHSQFLLDDLHRDLNATLEEMERINKELEEIKEKQNELFESLKNHNKNKNTLEHIIEVIESIKELSEEKLELYQYRYNIDDDSNFRKGYVALPKNITQKQMGKVEDKIEFLASDFFDNGGYITSEELDELLFNYNIDKNDEEAIENFLLDIDAEVSDYSWSLDKIEDIKILLRDKKFRKKNIWKFEF